jgi:hypothetical protein
MEYQKLVALNELINLNIQGNILKIMFEYFLQEGK